MLPYPRPGANEYFDKTPLPELIGKRAQFLISCDFGQYRESVPVFDSMVNVWLRNIPILKSGTARINQTRELILF